MHCLSDVNQGLHSVFLVLAVYMQVEVLRLVRKSSEAYESIDWVMIALVAEQFVVAAALFLGKAPWLGLVLVWFGSFAVLVVVALRGLFLTGNGDSEDSRDETETQRVTAGSGETETQGVTETKGVTAGEEEYDHVSMRNRGRRYLWAEGE